MFIRMRIAIAFGGDRCPHLSSLLERERSSYLDDAGLMLIGAYEAEVGIGNTTVRICEISVIKGVEKLATQAKYIVLVDLEILVHGKVIVINSRPGNRVEVRVAKIAWGRRCTGETAVLRHLKASSGIGRSARRNEPS
jgi:hypothetical protein